VLPAPTYANLPAARQRAARPGPAVPVVVEISVRVEVVTPILGGGDQIRTVDEVDIIRAPTVRGHLRFWWRALYARQDDDPKKLFDRESKLWGRAATDEGGRSAVELSIDIEKTGEIDKSNIRANDSRDRTPGAYALWPARSEKKTDTPAPRRVPGTQFRLKLVAPANSADEVRNALRAWLLFGGYGSRTRRGLGSFKVLDDASEWLPSSLSRDALTTLFGSDVFAPTGKASSDVPRIGGASLHIGGSRKDAVEAWTAALDWLRNFRQGTSGLQGSPAREPGTGKPERNRPSISNWPEPDKIRRLMGKMSAHAPRHNATPAWPRAGFGLPIIGRFQTKARDGRPLHEPEPFRIHWQRRQEQGERDRLASALIVKALPLAGGTFVPCALWLDRTYPDGDVILSGMSNSAAPFDRLVASGDTPRFSALAGKSTLRQAFLDWLHAECQTRVVAP
jgi:CRISPR-associated protein Cmr1